MSRRVLTVIRGIALGSLVACSDGATGNDPAGGRARLTINVAGVPNGAAAVVRVTGPQGFSRTLSTTETLTDLTPGSYSIAGGDAETDSALYAPATASQTVELTAGGSRSVDLVYLLASGVLAVTISGLPTGGVAAVRVDGPNGYSLQLAASATIKKLKIGSYQITALAGTADGDTYSASPSVRSVEITATMTPVSLLLDYVISSGRLRIQANGWPSGASAAFQIGGPNGFSRSAQAGDELAGLAPGSYTVTSPNVTVGSETYAPSPATLSVAVVASATPTVAAVAYASTSTPLVNLTIDNLYITQAVQTYVGDIPLVADRDGLVRVFAKASGPNSLQPQVRVRLYSGGTLLHTIVLNAPAGAVPTAVDDAALTSAWYGVVPAAYIKPGLSVVAEVDPFNTAAEISESDNAWPASGAAAISVKTVPTFFVRLVPVKQSNDLTGNVSAANSAAFLNDIRRMYPLGAVDADVRATYTTTAPILQADDNNGAWSTLLNELSALQVADASARYYYGVAKTSYSSGVAGIGYLSRPIALGWDRLPSGADVMAHELGHTWGRYHSPCGPAASPDPRYPYAGGLVGVSGYDLTTSTFKPPTIPDIMGYCVPAWVSDFTYKGIMAYRESEPAQSVASASSGRSEPGLLIWGRSSDTSLVLEPAFEIAAPPKLPTRTGPFRVEGLADDGSVVFSYAFAAETVDHSSVHDEHFAFLVPVSALRGRQVATLRLRKGSRSAELRSSAASLRALSDSGSTAPRVRRESPRRARIAWSDPGVRGVMLRDPRSGAILALVRNGSASVEVATNALELVISDGVRSHTRRAALR